MNGGAFGLVPQRSAKAAVPVAWDGTVTGLACARLGDARWRAHAAVVALLSAPELRFDAVPGVAGGHLAALDGDIELRRAAARALRDEIDELHDRTLLVGRAYELASDAVLQLVEGVAGSIAYGVGAGARTLALAALGAIAPWTPLLLVVGVSAAVSVALVVVPLAARLAVTHPQHAADVAAMARGAGVALEPLLAQAAVFWERTAETLLANEAFVTALGVAVESTDELVAGFLGVPPGVAAGLERSVGDQRMYAMLAEGMLLGTGVAAGLRERAGGGAAPRPVEVAGIKRLGPPPAVVRDPADAMRVIDGQHEQVVIHELAMPDGSTRYQVFVDGTQEFGSPQSLGTDPSTGLDGLANVENATSRDGRLRGSDAAVVAAMEAAGIGPDDPVDLFGYSQGAAASANVAASGRFSVETATLIGGPVASAEIPGHVAVLNVAHEGDLTPATAGLDDGGSPPRVLLQSEGGHGSGAFARHSRAEYVETLERVEGEDFAVDAHRQHLAAVTAGAVPVQTTSVQLRRP